MHEEDKVERNPLPWPQRLTRGALLPSSLPWFLVFPFLPLIGGVVILSVLIRPESDFSPHSFPACPTRSFSKTPSGL